MAGALAEGEAQPVQVPRGMSAGSLARTPAQTPVSVRVRRRADDQPRGHRDAERVRLQVLGALAKEEVQPVHVPRGPPAAQVLGVHGCSRDREGGGQCRTRSILVPPKIGGRRGHTVQEYWPCNTGTDDRNCKLASGHGRRQPHEDRATWRHQGGRARLRRRVGARASRVSPTASSSSR